MEPLQSDASLAYITPVVSLWLTDAPDRGAFVEVDAREPANRDPLADLPKCRVPRLCRTAERRDAQLSSGAPSQTGLAAHLGSPHKELRTSENW